MKDTIEQRKFSTFIIKSRRVANMQLLSLRNCFRIVAIILARESIREMLPFLCTRGNKWRRNKFAN